MKTEDIKYLLYLNRVNLFGYSMLSSLLNIYETIENLFLVSQKELRSLKIKESIIESIVHPNWNIINKDLKWLESDKHTKRNVISIIDPRYPELLKEISSPPMILFVTGNIKILNNLQLAIVGSRNPSPDGIDNAYEFSKYLSSQEIIVTSGLAIGIDTFAHKAAIDVNKPTIAVMGSGMDYIYPKSNKHLAKKIIDTKGLIISEYSIGTPVKPQNFPRRNRIISGLSKGVLVIEAGINSGSLITANFALDQNREIFAIPGSIHNTLSKGCHKLIKNGAKLVETANDIIEELNFTKKPTEINLSNEYKELLFLISTDPKPLDLLVAESGLSANIISSMLLELEIDGYVKQTSIGYIIV